MGATKGVDAFVDEKPAIPGRGDEGFPRLYSFGERGGNCVFVHDETDGFDSVRPENADARLKEVTERNLFWGNRPWSGRVVVQDARRCQRRATGHRTSDNPRGLKIRYKLLVPNTAVAHERSRFGPVIEREVVGAIDFDSGKLANSLPESVTKSNDIAQNVMNAVSWMEHEGMDAITEPSSELKGVGIKAKAVDKEVWDHFTPDQIVSTLAAAKRETWQDLDPSRKTDDARKTPATWVFETREGGKGILQVLGHSEQGAKVRYKLITSNYDAQVSPPGESYRAAMLPKQQLAKADAALQKLSGTKAGELRDEVKRFTTEWDKFEAMLTRHKASGVSHGEFRQSGKRDWQRGGATARGSSTGRTGFDQRDLWP